MTTWVNFYLDKGYEAEVIYEIIVNCGEEEIFRKTKKRKLKIKDNDKYGWTGPPEYRSYDLPNESRLKSSALQIKVLIKSWSPEKVCEQYV